MDFTRLKYEIRMMGKSSGHRNSEITAIYVGTTVITVIMYMSVPKGKEEMEL
jgi:hypothetical protein